LAQGTIENPVINSPFVEPTQHFVPDFLIRLRDAASTGPDDLLTLMLEVSGEARADKQAKVAAAEHLWTVAVNNWGGLGRWDFLEITDPWDAEHLIREKYLEPSPALT
jgi:type III restriction enzyme